MTRSPLPHKDLTQIITKHVKEKPLVQITLVDLINMDLAYLYFGTIFWGSVCAIAIEGQYLKSWPFLALCVFHLVSFVFLEYISIGIIIRFMQIQQGYMDIFWDRLDEEVRIFIRVVTVICSKYFGSFK